MIRWFFAVVLSLVMMLASCSRRAGDESAAAPPASDPANAQVFQVKGVVVELLPEENSVRIKHEEIPGYMAAMTMAFEVRDPRELAGLAAGDSVAFRLLVTDDDGWIDQVRKLPRATSNAPPTTGAFRLVRDVEPLRVGEVLPEYRFTNQLGRAISTSQFRGRALAITFIFTRCPFPTFCPRMMENFAGAQRQLLALASGPTNWHLLTLSIDPEFDTPAVLQTFGAGYQPDPRHWTLATGALIDITALAEQLGLEFWREPDGSISHNLRTVVVDPMGRVQKIFVGNQWTSNELAVELASAAKLGT